MGEVKKEKGKEREGGWVEAANPWNMWWVKSAVRRNYCQLLEAKDRQPTLRACLLLKQTDKMLKEFDYLSRRLYSYFSFECPMYYATVYTYKYMYIKDNNI